MEIKICQSSGIPIILNEQLGTTKDEIINNDYCKYCYKNGGFIDNVKDCVLFLTLKRWKHH